MSRSCLLAAVVAATAISSSAWAQDVSANAGARRNTLVHGAKSLSFGLPAGGNAYAPGTAGIWLMMNEKLNLGINVGLAIDRIDAGPDTVSSWDLLLAPAVRSYMMTDSVVAPYLYGQLNLRLYSDGVRGNDDDPELGVAGGIGVEWFPVANFSVGGQVGVGIDVLRRAPGEPMKIGTFTSGLSAQVYWE